MIRLTLAAILAATTVDPAIIAKMDAPHSLDKERGLYALLRFHDPSVRDDRDLIDRAFFSATSLERAAAVRGLCDRAPRDGAALGKTASDRVVAALDHPDTALRAAAVDCLERLPAKLAVELRLEQLGDAQGLGLPPVLTHAILGQVIRHPDKRTVEVLEKMSLRQQQKPGLQINTLPAENAWVLLAHAANGADVEPLFADTLKQASATDYALRARLNRIRAARGDAAALSALVETVNVAFEPALRREALELLLTLPAEQRMKAVLALESRLDDRDGIVRERLVRELSREATKGDAKWEAMLVRALSDVYPDLRVMAAAGLFDRAEANMLSADALAAVKKQHAAETDAFVAAALHAILRVPPPPAP